jgi:phosphoribosylformylglycinamidine synthase
MPAPVRTVPALLNGLKALQTANKTWEIGIEDDLLEHYYRKVVLRERRDLTDVELYQLANANSEHSRHNFFRGILLIDGEEMPTSLMEVVQRPWKKHPGPSIVAFHDNAGVIKGRECTEYIPTHPGYPCAYQRRRVLYHLTATAETHNHPTLVAPYHGAATGPGGRMRDGSACGRGSRIQAGSAGYSVGNLHLKDYSIPGEVIGGDEHPEFANPLSILIKGSNGVSDYGNKIGEPLIVGFCRTFGQMVGSTRYEARKPTLYTGGLGRIDARHTHKSEPARGMLIIGLGGPTYPVGFGGGSTSSGVKTSKHQDSVQRADPEMENRANRVIQACVDAGEDNPIELIHDQGAGGASNVLTELVEKLGGRIDLRKIVRGDASMSTLQVWVCESQERYGLIIKAENLPLFQMFCRRERVDCEVLGEVTGEKRIVVYDGENSTPVNLALEDILTGLPRKRFELERVPLPLKPLTIPAALTVADALEQVLLLPSVGSKGFLVHKVDRSVGGLIVRQQCCGPTQLPVADAGVVANSFLDTTGAIMAVGEQPIVGLIDPKAMARLTVAEALTNWRSSVGDSVSNVALRANWMYAAKLQGEGARLWDAANAMADFMEGLRLAANGGKDSLSMSVELGETTAISPGQLVIKVYGPVEDITRLTTPDLKRGQQSLGYLDLGMGKMRLGGSALAQALGQLGDECPDIAPTLLAEGLEAIGTLMKQGVITACHDISDGGLITSLVEMCLSGNRGAQIKIPTGDPIRFLFSQEIGFVIEYHPKDSREVEAAMRPFGEHFRALGSTSPERRRIQDQTLFIASAEGEEYLDLSLPELRVMWEATSLRLEEEQTKRECVEQERESHKGNCELKLRLSFTSEPTVPHVLKRQPNVAVVRDAGTNGDAEMRGAFEAAGCTATNIAMSDLLDGTLRDFSKFQGLALCGGFSRADVLGSARGWAAIIRFNQRVREIFSRFYDREDTFSLGICNGAQLMAHLDWILRAEDPAPYLTHNLSGRFESRTVSVRVEENTPSIFLREMEGSLLPVWAEHGEGRWVLPEETRRLVEAENLVPLRYVDPAGKATERYPFNPNGSPGGIAAVCSRDGRHLAVMPHPERLFLMWQFPHVPSHWKKLRASPWLRLFQNARDFCLRS